MEEAHLEHSRYICCVKNGFLLYIQDGSNCKAKVRSFPSRSLSQTWSLAFVLWLNSNTGVLQIFLEEIPIIDGEISSQALNNVQLHLQIFYISY